MNVLLVDDEYHVIEGLTQMIDWRSLNVDAVRTAMNGIEAWELFQHDCPDLVITDVAMPRMNGLELIQHIRRRRPELPVIILSGYDDFEYAKEAIHLNVSQYILKPAVYTEIYDAIKQVVEELEAKRRQQQYTERFQREMTQALPVLREQFLLDLVAIGKRREEVADSQIAFYQLDESLFAGGIVLSFALYRPQSDRVGSEKDWQLFKFSSRNIVEEILRREEFAGPGFVLRYVEDRLPVLLLDGDAERAASRADAVAREAVRCVNVYLGIDINAAIGRWYGTVDRYPLSHRESYEALKLLEYEGYQRVARADQMQDDPREWPNYPFGRVRLLAEALLRRDEPEAVERFEEIARELLQAEPTLGFAQTICMAIISNVTLKVMETDAQAGGERAPLAFFREAQQARTPAQTIELLRVHLFGLMRELQLRYQDQHGAKYASIVKDYVANHYHEPISFAELARELDVTRNYLSYLFKRDTGTSFINYLTGYRIERAKELLVSGRMMVYEVAEMVGYPEPAYFSRVFKNATGISPVEYMVPAKTEKTPPG